MKTTRTVLHIDEEKCDGCGLCVPACEEGAIQIVGGKARLVSERHCDGLGACIGECPRNALILVEKEAEPFDETLVDKKAPFPSIHGDHEGGSLPCGCPSAQVRTLFPTLSPAPESSPGGTTLSSLSHWPVQIRLIPPKAPFLENAYLLIAADCTAVACPRFHGELLPGKVVLLGCPKFDDLPDYREKFLRILRENEIRGITVCAMEVPCCQGLEKAVREAVALSGKNVPVKRIIVTIDGNMR